MALSTTTAISTCRVGPCPTILFCEYHSDNSAHSCGREANKDEKFLLGSERWRISHQAYTVRAHCVYFLMRSFSEVAKISLLPNRLSFIKNQTFVGRIFMKFDVGGFATLHWA